MAFPMCGAGRREGRRWSRQAAGYRARLQRSVAWRAPAVSTRISPLKSEAHPQLLGPVHLAHGRVEKLDGERVVADQAGGEAGAAALDAVGQGDVGARQAARVVLDLGRALH